MMGHTGLIKLDKNYFKSHVNELIDEYLLSVPNLTISDEERQKAVIEKLRIDNSELEKKNQKINQLEENQARMWHKIEDMKKTKPLTKKEKLE